MNDELQRQMAAKLQDALERVVDERSLIHSCACSATTGTRSASSRPTCRRRRTPAPRSAGKTARSASTLDAMVDWAEASEEGLRFYDVPDNPWRTADILFAGKIYE